MNYPKPCEECTYKDGCTHYMKCQPWLEQYLYRQEQINAYARKVLPECFAKYITGGDGGGNK